MIINVGNRVVMAARFIGATYRVWADEGNCVWVLSYNPEGRTDGVPIGMYKMGLQPADEPTDRDESEWEDRHRRYYRDDPVRLITPFLGWGMVVREMTTDFPGYALVDFGNVRNGQVVPKSMSWFVHLSQLRRYVPRSYGGVPGDFSQQPAQTEG